jgi:hypothetical protein
MKKSIFSRKLIFIMISILASLSFSLMSCSNGGSGGTSGSTSSEEKSVEKYVSQQVAQDVLYAAYAGSGSGVDFQDGTITISALDGITTGYIKVLLYEVLNPSGLLNIFYDADCECKSIEDCVFNDCIKMSNIYEFKNLLTQGKATFEYGLKKDKNTVGNVKFTLKPILKWSSDPNKPTETEFDLNIGFNKTNGYVSKDITSRKFMFTGCGNNDLNMKFKGYSSCYFAKNETVGGKQVLTPVPLSEVGDVVSVLKDLVYDAIYGTKNFKYSIVFSFYVGSGDINASNNLKLAFGEKFENIASYNDWNIAYSNKGNEAKFNNYYELPQMSVIDTPQYINKFYSLKGAFTVNSAPYPYTYDMVYGQLDGQYDKYNDPDSCYIGFEGDIGVPRSNGEKVHVYSINSKVFTDIFGGKSIDTVNFISLSNSINNIWKSGMLSIKDSSNKTSNIYLYSDGTVKFNSDTPVKDWKRAFTLVK